MNSNRLYLMELTENEVKEIGEKRTDKKIVKAYSYGALFSMIIGIASLFFIDYVKPDSNWTYLAFIPIANVLVILLKLSKIQKGEGEKLLKSLNEKQG